MTLFCTSSLIPASLDSIYACLSSLGRFMESRWFAEHVTISKNALLRANLRAFWILPCERRRERRRRRRTVSPSEAKEGGGRRCTERESTELVPVTSWPPPPFLPSLPSLPSFVPSRMIESYLARALLRSARLPSSSIFSQWASWSHFVFENLLRYNPELERFGSRTSYLPRCYPAGILSVESSTCY